MHDVKIDQALKILNSTLVSEQKRTFICDLILERYKYSKTTENYNICSKQKFFTILFSLKWSLRKTSRIIIIEVRRFCVFCSNIGGWFCITTFDVLSTSQSVFVYISYTVKMPLIYWLHSEVGSSPVFTVSKWGDFSWEKVVTLNVNTL